MKDSEEQQGSSPKSMESSTSNFTGGNNIDSDNAPPADKNIEGHNSGATDAELSPPPEDWQEKQPEEELDLEEIQEESQFTVKSICGGDDRRRIFDTTPAPWRYICRLRIFRSDGREFAGSGFFIGPRCIITNGHALFHQGHFGWASRVMVIPGQNHTAAPFGFQESRHFISVEGWTRFRNDGFDYGAIILPDETLFQRVQGYFGFRALSYQQNIQNAGYPAKKDPLGSLWYHNGEIERKLPQLFSYMVDTEGGHSGSPIWINSDGGRYVVGVHATGGCPNRAVRVTNEVAHRWNDWRRLTL